MSWFDELLEKSNKFSQRVIGVLAIALVVTGYGSGIFRLEFSGLRGWFYEWFCVITFFIIFLGIIIFLASFDRKKQ